MTQNTQSSEEKYEKYYDVVLRIQHSTMIRVKGISKEDAINKAKEQYYNEGIMAGLRDSEYYDGLIDVTAEEE